MASIAFVTLFAGCATFAALWWRERSSARHALHRSAKELGALHAAGLEIYGGFDLSSVLQTVTDQARDVLETRYAALAVIGADLEIRSFLTSGLTADERSGIGHPPQGHGLLGVALLRGERLRLRQMALDPRAEGFPANHPHMSSLLAVPITCKSPFRGNLYVTEKRDGSAFTAAEEETLARIAAKASLAIDTAHLHEQLNAAAVFRERLRIAHELHDGMVQMLAYVNTKALAVREFLTSGQQQEGLAQLNQLADVAREVYADAREGILGLRSSIAADSSFAVAIRKFVEVWQEQSAMVVELELDDTVEIDPKIALQLLRVMQEALANVRKHSRAGRIRVTLRRDGEATELVVADDGVGFDADKPESSRAEGFGLATMRERAQSVGVKYTLESEPGRGTTMRLVLPAETRFGGSRN
ncbi:MAG: GAF domain-containing sensor histidine kinase [Thermoanaerobaculia bacterium]